MNINRNNSAIEMEQGEGLVNCASASESLEYLCGWSRTVRCQCRRGFTLIEVVASLLLLGILLSGVFVALSETTKSVSLYLLKERAFSVAQRRMELLISDRKEPDSTEMAGKDEKDNLVMWELSLERENVGASVTGRPLSGKVIKATVTARCDVPEGEKTEIKLTRYFAYLKPLPGHAVATPLGPDHEEPEWYSEMKKELGREPTMDEVMEYLLNTGDVSSELIEKIDTNEDD